MKFNKILTAATAAIMALSMSGTSVFAANYSPVSGDSTSAVINKYLVMDENAAVPDVNFNFSIAPGTAIAAVPGTSMEVISPSTATGVTGSPTVASIAFSHSDTKATTVASGDSVTLDAGEAYVKHNTVADFSQVTFAEPGIYRWVVSETTATYDHDGDAQTAALDISSRFDWDTQATTPGSKTRYLDVYVTDNGSGTLAVSAYVLHEDASTPDITTNYGSGDVQNPGDAVTDKSDGYTNVFVSDDIHFGKEVTGNQGSKDKYFAVTLAITGAQPATTYAIDISGAEATSGSNSATIAANAGQTNVTSVTTDNSGDATQTFYLKDGQYVIARGLPISTGYAVTENAEDYKSTAGITQAINGTTAYADATSGTLARADIKTGYTNTRDGVIPTGVATAVAGALGLVAIAGAGLVASRRKKEED